VGRSCSHSLEINNNPVLLWQQSIDWTERSNFQFETFIGESSSDQPLDFTAKIGSQVSKISVIEVRKRSVCPYTNLICIGRTENNDIVFHHNTISKFHAYIIKKPGEDRYEISDAGSSNGIWINNRRLKAHKGQLLSNIDRIQFGPCIQVVYLTKRGFHDYLQQASMRLGIS
jgi:hypothetical protein